MSIYRVTLALNDTEHPIAVINAWDDSRVSRYAVKS
jgi:hypothetical protein